MHSTTIPVDMSIVRIDILEKISTGESQTERTAPLSSDIVAFGLDGSSNKLIEHGSGATLRLHELS
jgi:hypothetical protein